MKQAAVADPHLELGVPRQASEREIKDAYRRLAARWHPDRNTSPRAAERMTRINRAYQQILESGHVSAADESPAPAPPPASPSPRPSASARASSSASGSASSRNAEAEPAPRKPRPWWERDWGAPRWEADAVVAAKGLQCAIDLPLEDAAFGCSRAVKGKVADLCGVCAGSGRLVSRAVNCATCRGEARIRASGTNRWQACTDCGGDGASRKACESCDGTGVDATPRSYHFEVRIPAGVRDNQVMKLRGQGQRGSADSGDIELTIRLQPHPLFSFDEQQRLVCRLPVDFFIATAQGSIEVPTLQGDMLTVQLSRGATQVIEGQGYPLRDGQRGPMVVETTVVMPNGFDDAQRVLLRHLSDELRDGGYRHAPELAAWQGRVREWEKNVARRAA
jgi:molecular chaperone DnaJ